MSDSLRILLPFIFPFWNEFTTPLRHVMGVTHLRLLWVFRNHVGYSGLRHSRLLAACPFRSSPVTGTDRCESCRIAFRFLHHDLVRVMQHLLIRPMDEHRIHGLPQMRFQDNFRILNIRGTNLCFGNPALSLCFFVIADPVR